MTNEFRQYVLKNVPTKILLKSFRYARRPMSQWVGTHYIINYDHDNEVKIEVGRFAYWNPYKGHGCSCYYSTDEVKAELDTRENIK